MGEQESDDGVSLSGIEWSRVECDGQRSEQRAKAKGEAEKGRKMTGQANDVEGRERSR